MSRKNKHNGMIKHVSDFIYHNETDEVMYENVDDLYRLNVVWKEVACRFLNLDSRHLIVLQYGCSEYLQCFFFVEHQKQVNAYLTIKKKMIFE